MNECHCQLTSMLQLIRHYSNKLYMFDALQLDESRQNLITHPDLVRSQEHVAFH